jgi:hypothetical protein
MTQESTRPLLLKNVNGISFVRFMNPTMGLDDRESLHGLIEKQGNRKPVLKFEHVKVSGQISGTGGLVGKMVEAVQPRLLVPAKGQAGDRLQRPDDLLARNRVVGCEEPDQRVRPRDVSGPSHFPHRLNSFQTIDDTPAFPKPRSTPLQRWSASMRQQWAVNLRIVAIWNRGRNRETDMSVPRTSYENEGDGDPVLRTRNLLTVAFGLFGMRFGW